MTRNAFLLQIAKNLGDSLQEINLSDNKLGKDDISGVQLMFSNLKQIERVKVRGIRRIEDKPPKREMEIEFQGLITYIHTYTFYTHVFQPPFM